MKNHCTQPLRGILFDKDGTLLDLAALWRPAAEQTANEVLQHYCRGDFSLRKELLFAIGIRGEQLLPEGALVAGTNGDVSLRMQSVLNQHGIATDNDFVAQTAAFLTRCASGKDSNVWPTCPDLAEVLHTLRQTGIVLGLATSDRPESAMLHLQKLKIKQEFSFFGTDDGTHRTKPAADLMNAFCAQTGFSPAECAVVGDAPNDMRFAANSGSIGIFLSPNGCTQLPPGAQYSIRSLSELPSFIQ